MYQWDFHTLWQYRNIIFIGFGYTLGYTVIVVALGLLVGLVTGLCRLSPKAWISAVNRMEGLCP